MNIKEQGSNSENIFHGKAISEAGYLMYADSARLFSNLIKKHLVVGSYNLADLGSHKGEFLQDTVNFLPEYKFKTTAIDVNTDDLKKNIADVKIESDLAHTPLQDKTIDVTLSRYVLAWNSLEKQKEIIKEISRITKRIAIIQHQGADILEPEVLQVSSANLFSGVIPVLKRDNFFFSTSEQLEQYMREFNIKFEKVQDKKVNGLSSLLIEKYNLEGEESKKVKEILANSDYVFQTTWILNLQK